MTVDPYLPLDAAGRDHARAMLAAARDAVLAVLDPDGWPMTARIALQTDLDGTPLALLSGLAAHSAALMRDPRAALLIDAASPARGSVMARPRLSLQAHAAPVDPDRAKALRDRWRAQDPKSAVYVDLPDFRFWRFEITGGLLNAGFGRASRLGAGPL